MEKSQYVLGFLFSMNFNWIVLIRKNKPEWQKGLLNGVGGKKEKGETILQCMQREFKEEAGIFIKDWFNFTIMSFPDYEVWCFMSTSHKCVLVSSPTNEPVDIYKANTLRSEKTILNLNWLIPLAQDQLLESSSSNFIKSH